MVGRSSARGGARGGAGGTATPARPSTGNGHDPARPARREQETGAAAPPPAAGRTVHRWRDLDHRSRRWALAVAGALLLAPLAALAWFLPEWVPTGDPALMGLRALDVGTSRTPLLGQPSASGIYTEGVRHIHHPGPVHFYLLAVPVRVLGGAVGMPVVSALITGAALAVSAWAAFRQLGRRGGLVAATVLAAVAFTTGAASLVNPVSSSIAGYPLLATAVLMWCVAAGDVRLLPLAAAAASFTAQQHLSVVPATLVITLGGLALLGLSWWRSGRWRDPADRRDLVRSSGWAAAVALVLWTPVLAQQAFGRDGNLGQMLWFARHGNSDTLGYGTALRQVARALGLPPLLGRTEVDTGWLLSRPGALGWLGAAVVAAAVAALGWRSRTSHPRRAWLCAMTGVVALAGLVNGASVPEGQEKYRLSFYHWTFVLALFATLALALAVTDVVAERATRLRRRSWTAPALAGLVVAVMAVTAVTSPLLDRRASTLRHAHASMEKEEVDALADQVMAHRDRLGDHPVWLARNEPLYAGMSAALVYELAERGVPLRHPLFNRFYVADGRLVDRDEVDGGLLVAVDDPAGRTVPDGAELIASLELFEGLDQDAYRAAVEATMGADEVRLGPEGEAFLEGVDPEDRGYALDLLQTVVDDPEVALLSLDVLAFLRDYPLEEPVLDAGTVARLHDSLAGVDESDRDRGVHALDVYLLDRDQVLETAWSTELGRQD